MTKSSERRCPACGSPTTTHQNFCSRCGTVLPSIASAPAKRGGGWSRKILIALALLFTIAVIGNRLLSQGETGSPIQPKATTQAQLQPTRATDRDPMPTSAPPTQASQSWLPAGFVPAPWTTALPSSVQLASVERIVDGDTFDLAIDGRTTRYRLYRSDTPETYDDVECGGDEATALVRTVLQYSDTPGQVWVQSIGQLDRYDRTLAYLWFTIDGQPYLLNHALIGSGWAANVDYGDPFDPYQSELAAAAAFAMSNDLGVWGSCGAFGVPLGSGAAIPAQAQPPTAVRFIAQPTPAPMNLGGGDCDPNYLPCVPNVAYDLDCGDIQMAVQVIGYDRHNFDREGDGYGCESYG